MYGKNILGANLGAVKVIIEMAVVNMNTRKVGNKERS